VSRAIFKMRGSTFVVSLEDGGSSTDGVNRTVYTRTGFLLTGADEGKIAVISLLTWDASNGRIPSSVTIGGASAVMLCGSAGNSTNDHSLSMWSAVVPPSPTDAVVVTYAAGVSGVAISMRKVLDAKPIAFDTNHTNGGSSSHADLTTTLNSRARGASIACGSRRSVSSGGTITSTVGSWTEDDELAADSGFGGLTAASRLDEVSTTGETVTWTPSSSDFIHICAVSFRPR
jgi:hypothetical protein